MKESGNARKLEDRLLGDEWTDWQPGTGYEGIIKAPRGLFISFSFLALAVIFLGVYVLWYLALPRLLQFGPKIAHIAGIAVLVFCFSLFVWFILQVFSAISGFKFISQTLARRIPIRLLLPGSVRLGKFFGISRDTMGNSYLKFHNGLMRATKSGGGSDKFLILLPRCLSGDTRMRIRDICDKYKCRAFTAAGGDEARKIIRDERPAAVIGIACERDLISGINDIAGDIPVLAIPNRRPEGPCKNTSVDMEELDNIIRFCQGV